MRLEGLLEPASDDTMAAAAVPGAGRTTLQALRADAGPATLDTLFEAIAKLQRLRALHLPAGLFAGVSAKVLQAYQQRAAVEEPYELRRHPPALRVTLLAAFCQHRLRMLTDTLVELLIQLIHRIGARAEQKVEKELLEDLKRVNGKTGLLFRLAEASLEQPNGIVKEVIFPVVSEETLQHLVKEWKSTGPVYRHQVQTRIRGAYRSHYRRMLAPLLEALNFRSNNERYRPVIDALALLKRYLGSKTQYYPARESVPTEEVVPSAWLDAVVEHDPLGRPRVNRLSYEICVLQALREKLRCKEIWVEGADRYRNPDEDLPEDFDRRRPDYYAALGLPLDADTFIEGLKHELSTALTALDASLPHNPDVKILTKAGGWIKLSPLPAQPEPPNLLALKANVARRWPMTNLLDVLKETDLRVQFTQAFHSPTAREHLDRTELQYRLLLCLYALGTNAGLKRVAAGQNGVSYKDLLYTRRRLPRPGASAWRHRRGGQQDPRDTPASPLGRSHHGLCLGCPPLRGLGPEPADRVAHPLRRALGRDLLARRAQLHRHLFAVEDVLLLRGSRDDPGRTAPLHGDGDRPALRRQSRPEHHRICLLPAPGL
jgi:hypothetical protein